MFKVGDRVKRVLGGENEGVKIGEEFIVTEVYLASLIVRGNPKMGWHDIENLILAEKQNNSVGKIMNIIDFVVGLTIGEPQKSRQKAGIVDKNNIPTTEGMQLMVKWLMENTANVADFDSKVVAPILVEMDKECKK